MEFLITLILSVGVPILLVGMLVPWQILLRVAWAFGLLVVFERIISPPVHWSDQGIGYAIGVTLYTLIIGLSVVVLACRTAIRPHKGKNIAPVPWTGDAAFLAVTGAMIALALVLELSWDTQASDRPVLVHSVVFAVAIFLALVAWKGVARWALAGMAVTLALLVWWSAVRHPDLVLNAAEDVAAGRPHCIALANRKRAARRSDLTFLTMDKVKYPRHALLIIAGEDEGETRHWSYHRKAWLQRGGPLDGWRCTP